jgi:Peptidase family M1 domain
MKNLVLSLLILVSLKASTLTAEIVGLPNTLRYKLDLRIDYNSEKMFGLCEITISNGTDNPVINVPVLLYRLLTVTAVRRGDGTPLKYNQKVISITGWEKLQVNFIEISLEHNLLPGEQSIITIAYEGYLLGYANEGWRYVRDHISKDFTIIRTDGFDYPVIGYPDEQNMMAVIKERYDYLINITLPEGVTPVSGAELVNKVSEGEETTYTFRSKKPSWRLDVAIDDYQVYDKNGNKIYYFKEDSVAASIMLHSMERTVDLLTDWFGSVRDFKGYSIIEVPEGYSSQQDVTSFNITADNFNNPEGMLTIYHEISHLWNVKPLEPQPCRFESEGLAQFMEFLISEKLDKKEHAVYEAAQKYLDNVRKDFNEKPEYQDVSIDDYGIRNMTSYSYTLGMVIFSLFYDLTGQERFNQIIRSFYSSFGDTGATLDDFINNCKRSVPFNAERFFNDWIYSTNAIKLIIEEKSYDELKDYYKAFSTPTSAGKPYSRAITDQVIH